MHRILGVVSHETAAVAQQHWLISVDDRLKGGVVPRPGEGDQTGVRFFPIKLTKSGLIVETVKVPNAGQLMKRKSVVFAGAAKSKAKRKS